MLINNSKAPLCAIDNCRTIANHCIWTKLLIRSTTKQNGIFYDLICVISEVCLGLTSDMTYGGADRRIVLPWQAKCKKRTHTDFISVFSRSSCCVSRSVLQWLRVFVKPSSSGITIISRLFFWGLDSWPFSATFAQTYSYATAADDKPQVMVSKMHSQYTGFQEAKKTRLKRFTQVRLRG